MFISGGVIWALSLAIPLPYCLLIGAVLCAIGLFAIDRWEGHKRQRTVPEDVPEAESVESVDLDLYKREMTPAERLLYQPIGQLEKMFPHLLARPIRKTKGDN